MDKGSCFKQGKNIQTTTQKRGEAMFFNSLMNMVKTNGFIVILADASLKPYKFETNLKINEVLP